MQSPLISYGSDSVANVNLLTYTEKGTEPLLKRPITVYKYKSVNININPQNDIHILYDFLIDGYIRNIIYNGTTYQEYNAQLFPIAVKQIIESHCRQTECEWRLISYFKQKRQVWQTANELAAYWESTQMVHIENQHKWCSILGISNHSWCICLLSSFIITSIAAIVISYSVSVYSDDQNACNNDMYSVVHPLLFTTIAGVVSVFHIILFGLYRFIIYVMVNMTQYSTVNAIKKGHNCLYLSGEITTCIMLLFYASWSIIGFCMYNNEMSSLCRHSSIGIMAISWSLIIFIQTLSYYRWYSLNIFANKEMNQEIHELFTGILKGRFVALSPWIIISICCVIIGTSSYHYDNICAHNNVFKNIPPYLWMTISGIATTVHILWILLCSFIKWESIWCADSCIVFTSIGIWIVYLVWSIFGFLVFSKMPDDCKGTQFGVLVNVWCNLMISAPAFLQYMLISRYISRIKTGLDGAIFVVEKLTQKSKHASARRSTVTKPC
eukprot:634739_1